MSDSSTSIYDLILTRADTSPDAIALLSPNHEPLTYRSLLKQADSVRQSLGELDVGNNDRVALVMPNGPDLATAFLAVSGCATSAPLNPAYRADELAFYLSDLEPKALIVDAGTDTPARAIADSLAIPTLEVRSQPDRPAGCFSLLSRARGSGRQGRQSGPDDIALVLHTSGTTSRPKIVPLSQTNLVSSAINMRNWYQLQPADRCLSIMPLFHIQGLVGGLLASIAAGASVVCAPPFDPDEFFAWLDEFEPTWYTAGPTFHQAIVLRADAHQDTVSRNRLRYIRSSSAPLSPATMASLESVFDAPVLEGYGMTETALHSTSNPLPPQARKPGCVGLPAAQGVDVAIMDENGELLTQGAMGEIVIRGPTVLRAYAGNPQVNEVAFVDGWLRTGDQGRFDEDGYLTITGRLKEIINRGGEKIAPAEVDAALLSHPDVAEAASFPVPHRTLGEDVSAAVVLRANATADEKGLRRFVAEKLTDFKVPRKIALVERIPKSHTGKLQRSQLADKLGMTKRRTTRARDTFEKRIEKIWKRVLERKDFGIKDNFFELGGDSLKDVVMFSEIEGVFGVSLESDWWWLSEPTIEQLAKQIRTLAEGGAD